MMYQHYKGGFYYTLGITLKEAHVVNSDSKVINAYHTENGDNVFVSMKDGRFYVDYDEDSNMQLYLDANGWFWVRPRSEFFGSVEYDGKTVPRFKLVSW